VLAAAVLAAAVLAVAVLATTGLAATGLAATGLSGRQKSQVLHLQKLQTFSDRSGRQKEEAAT